MNNTINYSSAALDLSSNLSLNILKQLIEPFRDMKILVGITCKPEFYDYLIKEFKEVKSESLTKDYYGVNFYKIVNQDEPIKYFYNRAELNKYLKNNV